MKLVIKNFDELTTAELYEILKVRSEVFVVEQKCAYQDVDGLDCESLHIFLEEDGNIQAYLRIFEKEPDENLQQEKSVKGETAKSKAAKGKVVQIGRVLTMKRSVGLGKEILKAGIEAAKTKMEAEKIYIEAQVYAMGFYEKAGFKAISEEFLEDGIPHIAMELSCRELGSMDWR